ncbi:isoaspartyl peptidase/L-asparaginase family protein [Aureliella helgolandensis]|uniref:Isoaspartyl peptidase n=1 Tax=Aureliella helgolandensis TaxID=2527968 RepID=A0A518G948_9BACT|nr:isoaspartyl peptidase/L-asparaginase [Aureliella helgolandensis]QDV25111.1 Isoaspartyl peptidase precursor [Aureliella helgolandensis]
MTRRAIAEILKIGRRPQTRERLAIALAFFSFFSFGGLWGSVLQAEESAPKYAIVIHGGAGSVPSNQEWSAAQATALEHALSVGERMLQSGASSLDTVEAVVRLLEDSPYFNAGKGAVFNAAENHELDSTIMDGRNRATGAVGGVTTVKNPVSLARKVMTDTAHVLLVSKGAEEFADEYADDPTIERVPNSYFSTEHRRASLHRAQQSAQRKLSDGIGTVGCVALDNSGNLAAATSTGGLNNKKFGRLGDSPIAGAGTFADNATCAVSCTGIGEDFIRNAVAYDISARMEYKHQSLDEAIAEVLNNPERLVRGGIIAVGHQGEIVMRFNTPGMARAAADSKGLHEVHVQE